MEGLNKLCLRTCTWEHEYPSIHGLSSIAAGQSRSKLKNLEYKPKGDHSHFNNGMHRHATPLTLYFIPLHQPKNPVFKKNCHPKSYFFYTVQNFGNCSLKDPKLAGIWEKGTQMTPLFMAFVVERSPFFLPCIHMFEGNVAPSNTVRSWKILYSWLVQFGEYF